MQLRNLELAFIVPTAYIDTYGAEGNFHLVLSHLMDAETPNEYENKMVASSKRLVIDNGCFEQGIPEEVETLMQKAIRIKASHVFAPDYLYDAAMTRNALNRMIEEKKKYESEGIVTPKIAAVCQANTLSEYLEEYQCLCNQSDVDLIGVSIITVPRVMNNKDIDVARKDLLEILNNTIKNHKPAHLLGLGSSYQDVLFAAENIPWVVSNDTSSCFQNGLHGRMIVGPDLRVEGGKIEDKIDFDLKEITEDQKKTIEQNIKNVRNRF